MPRIEVDLSDEGIRNPTADAGMYPFEVTAAKFLTVEKEPTPQDTKSQKGSTMIQWELTLTKPGDFFGHKVSYSTSLADKAVKKDEHGNWAPDPDAARTANYYLRENFLKIVKAPWDKSGFSTDDVIHCKGKAKITKVPGRSGDREFNQVSGIFPSDE